MNQDRSFANHAAFVARELVVRLLNNAVPTFKHRARTQATALCLAAVLIAVPVEFIQGAQSPRATSAALDLALQISDFAALPITGSVEGAGNNAGSLARINGLREEPGPAGV